MVERQLPKLHTGVRFPSPAVFTYEKEAEKASKLAEVRTKSQNTSLDFALSSNARGRGNPGAWIDVLTPRGKVRGTWR
jgi:hypothetical protein